MPRLFNDALHIAGMMPLISDLTLPAQPATLSRQQDQELRHLHAELDRQNHRRLALCRQAVERWLEYQTGSSLSSAWLEFKSHMALAKLQRVATVASGIGLPLSVLLQLVGAPGAARLA